MKSTIIIETVSFTSGEEIYITPCFSVSSLDDKDRKICKYGIGFKLSWLNISIVLLIVKLK